MLAFQEVESKTEDVTFLMDEHVKVHGVYTRPNEKLSRDVRSYAAPNDPYALKDFCHATKDKLVVHFSRESCELAAFCNDNRGPVLTKWLTAWRDQCFDSN